MAGGLLRLLNLARDAKMPMTRGYVFPFFAFYKQEGHDRAEECRINQSEEPTEIKQLSRVHVF